MEGSSKARDSLRAWMHALPGNVLTRYALELRDFDPRVTGVSPAIELLRSELRDRENSTAPAEIVAAAPEELDARIRRLMDHCRTQRGRNADVLNRSQRAIDRLETALAFAEPAPLR